MKKPVDSTADPGRSGHGRRRAPVMLLAILAVAAGGLPSAPARAGVAGEVIVAYQRYAGRFAVFSPSGSSYGVTACGGDTTYGGSPRHYANVVLGPNVLPSWYFGSDGPYYNTELGVSDEDCASTTLLTHEGNKLFGAGRWSPDGSKIAAFAAEFDLSTGALLRRGIFVADLVYDGSRPAGAINVTLVIPTTADRSFAWAPDSRRIVYVEAGVDGSDLFVHALDDGTTANVTRTPGVAEDQPAWSATGRIAYTRQSSEPRGSYRFDIYSIPESGGREFQVTSKGTTGAPVNMQPCYAPDGLQISFSSGPYQMDRSLYRIRADGSTKAVKIAGGKNQDWRASYWRP
jgi:Tol biopolymer transport system component